MMTNTDIEEIIEKLENGSLTIEQVPEEQRSNRDVLLAAVVAYCDDYNKVNPLKFAPEEMLADREFMLEVSASGKKGIYDYEDDTWNPEVDGPLAWAAQELLADRQFVLEVIGQSEHGHDLFYASESLQADREVVLEAIHKSGDALKYASKELQSDGEIVFEAIKDKYGHALKYASEELRADKGLILRAVKQNNLETSKILPFAANSLRADQIFMNELRDIILSGFTNEVKAFFNEEAEDHEDVSVDRDLWGTGAFYSDFTMMVECSGFANYQGQILIRYQEPATTLPLWLFLESWRRSVFPNKKIRAVENIKVEFSEDFMPVSTRSQLVELKAEVERITNNGDQTITDLNIESVLLSTEPSTSIDDRFPFNGKFVPWYDIIEDDEYIFWEEDHDIATDDSISRTYSDRNGNLLATDQWQSCEYEYPISFVDRKYDLVERQRPILESVHTQNGSVRFYLADTRLELRFLLTFDEIKKILAC